MEDICTRTNSDPDHFYQAVAGCRSRRLREGEFLDGVYKRVQPEEVRETPFLVAFNHGAGTIDGKPCCLAIDDLFFFETEEDACWFFAEGYKAMMYDTETEVDTLTIIITCECGEEALHERSFCRREDPAPTLRWYCAKCYKKHEFRLSNSDSQHCEDWGVKAQE